MNPNPTDEDIQKQLAAESVRGPRAWRGQPLAPLSRGLRDLRNKVIRVDDTQTFHDSALLHILAEAHAATPEERLRKRDRLMAATDYVSGFRAAISLLIDDLSDADAEEARRLVDELLGTVQKAEVSLAEKKTAAGESAELSPTTTSSPAPSSPAAPGGPSTTSAGS